MNAARTGAPSQFDRLLDSHTPRAIWIEGALFPNAAFSEITGLASGSDLEPIARDSSPLQLAAALEDLAAGQVSSEFMFAGYRGIASRLSTNANAAVLLELRERDLTQIALAGIVSAYERASNWQRYLPEFIDALLKLPGGLFTRVVVLRSRPSEPFIAVGGVGQFARGDRSWLRWPLRRLYEVRRAARITNLTTEETAIAFPMQHAEERTVALAVLSRRGFSISEDDLLVALETMRFTPSDRVHEDVVDMDDPRFMWIGHPNKVLATLRDLTDRRGWHLQVCPRLAGVAEAVAASSPDVVLFNGERFPNAAHVLRTMRETFVGQITIVGIGTFAMPRSECAVLLDDELANEAMPQAVLDALKFGVRNAVSARRREANEALGAARRTLGRLRSVSQLTISAAQEAATLVGGWAAVHLIDENGRMLAAESPTKRNAQLLPHLPELFVSGESILRTHVDDAFYEAITTEPSRLEMLRSLHAYSGVAVPIMGVGVRTIGALTAIARKRRSTQEELEAVAAFAAVIGQRYEQLQCRPRELETREPWRRGTLGGLDFASYAPPSSLTCARLMPLDSSRCALVLCERSSVLEITQRLRRNATVEQSLENDRGFAGIANFANKTLRFAVHGIPPPLLLGSSRPWGAFDAFSDGQCSGTVSLREGSTAIVSQYEAPPEVTHARDIDELTSTFEPENYAGVIIALAMRNLGGL